MALCKILARDAQSVLRCQHLEIGVGGSHYGGKADNLTVVAGGNRGLFGRADQGTVLAPKVDLVAGVECGRQVVGDDGDASTRPRNADNVRATGGLGLLILLGVAVEIDNRQQCGASDAGIRIRLHDASDRCGNIEIALARRFDDFGQFARAEGAPPVERRHSCFRCRRIAWASAISGRDIEPRLRLVARQQAAPKGQREA